MAYKESTDTARYKQVKSRKRPCDQSGEDGTQVFTEKVQEEGVFTGCYSCSSAAGTRPLRAPRTWLSSPFIRAHVSSAAPPGPGDRLFVSLLVEADSSHSHSEICFLEMVPMVSVFLCVAHS